MTNPVGRPLAFKTPEELEIKIEQYFLDCKEDKRPYTMGGLAVALGVDRKTIINYSNKDEYFHTIKKAREIVESYAEEQLYRNGGQVAGIIFNLKNNFDWKDKTEQDVTTKGEPVTGFLYNKPKTQDDTTSDQSTT